jgi:hypothetical protein
MIAGPDADGTMAAMRIVVGEDTLTAAKCITTRVMAFAVAKPSPAEAGSTVAVVVVSMVDAAKR